MNINKAEPTIYKTMAAADNAVKEFDIAPKLKELRSKSRESRCYLFFSWFLALGS